MTARAPSHRWRILVSGPMVLLHLAAVVAVGAAAALGWWQVGAWSENRADRAAEIADAPAVPLDQVLGPDDAFPSAAVGRPVQVSGRWLPESTVQVTGRDQRGQRGRWLVTTLALSPDTAVPVVLGWWDGSGSAPAPPRGPAELTGWLQPGDAGQPDPDPTDDVLPSLRIADLLQRLDRDLYSGYVIADEAGLTEPALTPVTPETLPEPPRSTALRNLLYGLEWWVFGLFALYVWWRWCRDALRDTEASTEGGSGVTGVGPDTGSSEPEDESLTSQP